MKFTKSLLVAAMLLNTTMASAAFVTTNTMNAPPNNDLGADGYVSGDFPSFTIRGANNGGGMYGNPIGGWLTTYADTFASDTTVSFDYFARTNDAGGWGYDSVGYFLNNAFYQLTPQSSDFFPPPVSGSASVNVLAGDLFGWYARSGGATSGPIYMTVNAELNPSAVPVPAALPLLASALGAFGIARRRNKAKSV